MGHINLLQVVGVLRVRPKDLMRRNGADLGLGYALVMLIDP